MTKAELELRLAEVQTELEYATKKLAVLEALNNPRIASSDPGSPVHISWQDGHEGVLVYQGGATLFSDTETVGAVGDIPAEVLMEELKWARR